MANDPTIIIGSLNDKELKSGIESLVNAVEQGTQKMKQSFDTTIDAMKKKLAELWQVKPDLGGTNSSSEKRKNDLDKEKDKVDKLNSSYDQTAKTMQQLVSASSAKNSMYNILDALTRQAASARQEMQKMNDLSWERAIARWKAWQEDIDATKQKIAQLKERLQNTVNPNARKGIEGLLQEEQKHLEYLRGMQEFDVNRQIQLTQQEATAKKQAYEQTKQQINELIGKQKESATATVQQTTEQERLNQKIQRQVELLKQQFAETGKSSITWGRFVFDNPQKTGDISLEEQVANAHLRSQRRIAEQQKEITAAKQETAQAEQRVVAAAQKVEVTEKDIQATIAQQAELIRQRFQNTSKNAIQWQGATITRPVNEKDLSIEEQIAQYKNIILRLTHENVKASQQQAQAEQKVANATNAQKKKKQLTFGEYESLRTAIASVLNVETQAIKIADTETASRKQLEASLKTLKQAYASLNAADRNTDNAKHLLMRIHELELAIDNIQRKARRPISLHFIKNSMAEDTIDAIVQKIRKLQEYRGSINILSPNAKNEIKEVDNEIDKLNKKLQQYTNNTKHASEMSNALARSWNYMKNRLAFYFTVGASTQFVKNLIEIRSQYEMNEKALGILIGSAEYGTQVFQELSNMALVSPYTLIELSSAAKQLSAYDIAARDVVDTTRRLADMASAVGVPMERLTYALGQIKAYGYLNSRDARMFANAGIPLVKELSNYYSELEGKLVSIGDVYDRIKKKQIGFEDVMDVVTKMTDEGGRFFDFQAKMADTLKVRLANLTLAWNNMLNDIGKSNQGILTTSIGLLRSLFTHWKQINSAIKSAMWAGALVLGVRALNVALVKLGLNWKILRTEMTMTQAVGGRLTMAFGNIGKSIKAIVSSPLTWWTLLAFYIVSVVTAISDANRELKEFNKSMRQGAEDNFKNVNEFLKQYKDIRDKLYEIKTINLGERERKINNETTVFESAPPVNVLAAKGTIPDSEAVKAWEAIREQIELTSRSSDIYISRLMQISNMSERVRQGFGILESISEVNAALKDVSDTTFKVTSDWSQWWNLWQLPDGLIENIKDYTEEQKDMRGELDLSVEAEKEFNRELGKYNMSIEESLKLTELASDEAESLKSDVKDLTDSIVDFINLKGMAGAPDKINEVFDQVINKLSTDNGLTPEEAFNLQLQVEEARTEATRKAYEIRIADETAALAAARDKQSKNAIAENLKTLKTEQADFESHCGRGRVIWADFTKWMSEQHINEVREKFRDLDAEDIAHLDFSKGEWHDWAINIADKFAKEHNLATSDVFGYLHRWVQQANLWNIFIKLHIVSDGGGSVYDQLTKLDTQVDEADAKIKRLTADTERLGKVQNRNKKEEEQYQKGLLELQQAREDKENAIKSGGKSKQDEKDAKAAAKEAAKQQRAAAAARRKQERAAAKAQREAESELQKTLKNELSLIDKVRSAYQGLIQDGASHTDAIKAATNGYAETVKSINKVLAKWGLKQLDLSKFAGISNPRELVDMLQSQLDKLLASGKVKQSEIKDLQVKIGELELDAQKFDLKKLKDGLNNQLSKLKDEYEFAVELDSNPELGETFASLIGLDTSALPHDVGAYAEKYLEYLNKYLKDAGSQVQLPTMEISNEELEGYEEMTKTMQLTEQHFELIKKGVMEIRDLRKKEISERMSAWQTLLEKYSEYEYKMSEIHRKAAEERKKADKTNAPKWVYDAINKRENRDVAQLNFDEFQKSQTWITATGDLAGLTNNALELLINRIKEYRKNAKNLDPKNILKINKALRTLSKQQRSNNPFLEIINVIQKAKERFDEYQTEIDETTESIKELEEQQERGIGLDDKQTDKLKRLKELLVKLKEEQLAISEISPKEVVEAINTATQAASQAVAMFDELAQAIGGKGMTKAAETLKEITGILEKTAQGASMGAMFGGYGAAIGAIAGAAVGIITTYADQWSGNESINYHIKKSELAVKRLELAYIDLEKAIDNAYGTGIIGARKLAAENKKAELAELKRQLELEKERKAKNRDEEKIIDLQTSIRNLEYEIAETIDEIVNTLLGISSVGDAAETLMDGFVEALRNGEDAMAAFNESIDEMIASIVKKMLTTKIIQPWFEAQWAEIQSEIDKRTSQYYNEYEELLKQRSDFENVGNLEKLFWEDIYGITATEYENNLNTRIKELENLISTAGGADIEDIKRYAELLRSGQPIMEENMKEIEDLLRSLGLIKDSAASSNLSALQQGIQGITEDTAGAIEAYMNGVSQQVYLHSDLLTQIRDAVVLLNTDVQVATIGQILLQLQASYQVQMTIQSTLNGWSNPSGQAVRVELIQ